MADDQIEEGVLRNSRPLAATVIFGIFALAGLVLAGVHGHYGGLQRGLHLLGVGLAPSMFIFALRSAQSSIKWNRQRVVARGAVAKTRRLAWSEIAGFEYRKAVVGARLADGRWVRLMPYPRGRPNNPEQAIAALEAARPVSA